MAATYYRDDILLGAVIAGKILAVIALIQLLRGIWWFMHMLLIRPPMDPLRHLRGPEGKKFENHFQDVLDPDRTPETHESWVRQFGKTFRFHGFGSFDYRLMSFDFRAVSHILTSPAYEKPWQTRRVLTRLLGRGVFAMEGEEHRIQRKLMAPAFSPQSLKAMSPVMFLKAEELRDRWDALIAAAPSKYRDDEKSVDDAKIDVMHWVSRATFDVIGLAGFDYSFQALKHESEEVYLAYRTMFNAADKGPGLKKIAEIFFPIIEKLLPDEGIRETNRCLKTIRRAGEKLVANKKAAILAEIFSSKDIQSKDILSLLIKSNLSEDSSQRLSDNELLDQLSTFLFAGSDTTAISIAWMLYYLALNPSIQTELRDELIAAASHDMSHHHQDPLARLESLPLLDAVVRETMRIAPPVHGTIRVATKDDILPLSEPIVTRSGETVQEVHVKKGSYVHIPIEGLNLSKDIWGEDALEFNPSRWTSLPTSARQHPGLANLMTFSFGPHSCIGWRFSLLEMRIFLSTLLPHFQFAPVAGVTIGRYNAIVTRPYVRSRYVDGPALPLMVSHYQG